MALTNLFGMPIYEFRCNDCAHEFEVLMHGPTTPECPACRSRNLARQLSVFAVAARSATAGSVTGPCRTCGDPRGPGACQLN